MNFYDLLVVQQSIPSPLQETNYTKINIAIAPPSTITMTSNLLQAVRKLTYIPKHNLEVTNMFPWKRLVQHSCNTRA